MQYKHILIGHYKSSAYGFHVRGAQAVRPRTNVEGLGDVESKGMRGLGLRFRV